MTGLEVAEIVGSLIGSLLAFGTTLYLLLVLYTLRQHATYSIVVECLTVCMGFIFGRQVIVVLLAAGVFGDGTAGARQWVRYLLTFIGVVVSGLVFFRMARWQALAQQASAEEGK